MIFKIGDNALVDVKFDEDEYLLSFDFMTKINGDHVTSIKLFCPEYDGLRELSQCLQDISKYMEAKAQYAKSQRTRPS